MRQVLIATLLLLASCHSGLALAADSPQLARGEAIATQGGCAGCHTPPGGAPYSGFQLGGWTAFNITSDPVAGIGDWSDEELLTYLRTGHVNGKAQAGGPMAAIIETHTASLSDEDLAALAAYLRSIPAANPTDETRSRSSYGQAADDVDRIRGEPFAGDELASGARLYLGNCAACHGPRGQGSDNGYYPSLVNNSAVGAASADNLVNVIMHGVSRTTQGQEYFMPGFAQALTDGEVVSLASYVMRRFGRPEVRILLDDVQSRRQAAQQ
jgi:mono/diheme cytochrome c family protein